MATDMNINNSFKWQKMPEKIFSSETTEPFEDLLQWFYNILTTSFEINEKQEITGSVKPLVYIYYQMCHFQCRYYREVNTCNVQLFLFR